MLLAMPSIRKRVGEAARAEDDTRKRMKGGAANLMGLEGRITIDLTLDDEPARKKKTFIDLTGDSGPGPHEALTHRACAKDRKTSLSTAFAPGSGGKEVRKIATVSATAYDELTSL